MAKKKQSSKPTEAQEREHTDLYDEGFDHPVDLPVKEGKPKKIYDAPAVLNINSIIDMMTILLVYLLVSMTSDPLNIKMDDYLVLARSNANFAPKTDSIPITVTKKHVIVDNKPIVTVHCKFQGRECTDDDLKALASCQAYIQECGPQALDYEAKINEKDPKVFQDRLKECQSKGDKACSIEELKALETIRFYFDKTDKQDGDENQFLVVPLLTKLKELVKNKKEEDQMLQIDFKGITTVIADRHIPFRMLAEVVHTAGMAELNEIRFAIIKHTAR
jgi:hypothetical protein